MVSGDLIREARLRAGLTQYQLAERAGRERSVIARWEQGGSAPSLETLLELVRVCGFDLPLELAPRDEAAFTRLRKNVLLSPERRVEQLLRARRSSAKGGDVHPFDPYPILAALERRRVAYIVVGAFARIVHGADEITHSLDMTPSLRTKNLERLEFALRDLIPTPADSPPRPAEQIQQQPVITFATEHGALKVIAEPAGTRGGYDDLRRTATREPIGKGLRPPVASAPDLARMLGALGRDQDLPTLFSLRRLIQLERHRGLADFDRP